jgi:uracil-DNA glycosylase family 4
MSEAASDTPLHPLPALHVLAAFFEAQSRAGKSRIFMRPEARESLREICRMKPGRNAARPASARPAASAAPAAAAEPAVQPQRPPVRETRPAAPRQVLTPPVATPLISPDTPSLSREERTAALAAVAQRAAASPAARALGTLRETMVFATGNPEAELMLVGEAPGAQEEQQGEPFVGPAGQLLDKILKAMGMERSAVYISNICKFRPSTGAGQGSSNRKPTLTEMQSCLEFIHEEISIVRPRVIVALGATAAEGFLQRPVTVGSVRGRWLDCRGVPLIVTYHPSYLLHREADGPVAAQAEKRKCWEDMLKVMERMALPISDKQRAFFLPKH